MDALHRYACSRLSNKTAVVREWIDSLASSADVQALPRATPAKVATPASDANVLPEAKGEPSTIGFNPAPAKGLAGCIAAMAADPQSWARP